MADPEPNIIYFNSRIHGMRSHLFERGQIEEMLSQDDLSRMMDTLLESAYHTELAEATTRFSGADAIEEGVTRNMVHTFQNMIAAASGDFKELVSVFLMRWDLDAVKSLIRCRHHNLPEDATVSALIPGPTLTMPILQDFAKIEDMEGLVKTLAAWNRPLCRPLRDALPAYEEAGDVRVLEEALDQGYFVENVRRYSRSEDENAAQLVEELRSEIDRINLRSVFQCILDKGDKDQTAARLLPEGTVKRNMLQSMLAADDVAGAMEHLAATRYQGLLEELFSFLQTGRFSPVERFFERLIMHRLRRLSQVDVFGLGVMMNFTWLKFNEVVNLRLIARGLAGHVPPGRVREELHFSS
jgi:vacuolar-type H+-ATPase subunit C/Vma6